jgi:hypothetical protein
MLNQAINLSINDWHPPLLIWIWGKLFNPALYGPLFPFLIQNLVFWTGVALISISMLQKSRALGLLLPYFFLVLPQTFIVYWVCTDGSFVAISTFALGFISLSVTPKFNPKMFLIGISFGSLAFISRPYLWIIVGTLLLIFFTFYPLRKLDKPRRATAIAVLIFPLLAVSFTSSVIRPANAYPESPVLLFDLMAMECQSRESYNKVPEEGLLPRFFLLSNVEDFCSEFSKNKSFVGYFLHPTDTSQTRIRWIENSKETRIAAEAWFKGFMQNPDSLIERKIFNFIESNRSELYASGLAPNPILLNMESTKIGFGGLDGHPVQLGNKAISYMKFQSWFNSSWLGGNQMAPPSTT